MALEMQKQTNNEKFNITTRSGEVITLSKKTVEDYLTNGQAISNSEFTMFFQMCKNYQVNPFLREAYIVKYGNQPATIVLDYKVLQQTAENNPAYAGMKTGVLVINGEGKEIVREGSYLLPNETLVAGWCEVARKDRSVNNRVYSMFDEFKQFKKDGGLNSNWSSKPVFMITKVAKAQALREAFPNMFGSNIYISEELGTEDIIDTSISEKEKTESIILDEELNLTESE